VTLANPAVRTWLKKHAVSGWTNNEHAAYAGSSNRHSPGDACKTINNGAGARNVQQFFLTSDGRVLDCLPGFWNPVDWLAEATFALALARVADDRTLSADVRNEKFLAAHLARITVARTGIENDSQLQPFDKRVEKHSGSDFTRAPGLALSKDELKSVYQVFHERMAERPYLPFERFDVAAYVEMGQRHYSYRDASPTDADPHPRSKTRSR